MTSLDLDNNTNLKILQCGYTGLTFLDLHYNRALELLYCANCQLTILDLSWQTALRYVDCSDNSNLTGFSLNCANTLESLEVLRTGISSLYLNNYSHLKELYCFSCSQLTALTVTGCTALKKLRFNDCPISSINLSDCTALEELNCCRTNLTSLNLNNLPQLANVDASENTQLTTVYCSMVPKLNYLGLSNNSALTELYCNENGLTSFSKIIIDYCDALQVLSVLGNQFSELEVYGKPNLTNLEASNNAKLFYVNISNNPKLEQVSLHNCPIFNTLHCTQNPLLTYLGLTSDPALTTAEISYNASLASLNMSWNSALETLTCNDNALTSLEVAACTNLQTLNCDNNLLTSLPQNYYMKKLSIKNNRLNEVHIYLPYTASSSLSELIVDDNTTMTELTCISLPTLTRLSAKNCTSLTSYVTIMNNSSLTNLILRGCTSMTHAYCSNNALCLLRLDGCTALRYVECYNNQLNDAAMTTLVGDLPTIPTSENPGQLRVLANNNEGNVFTSAHLDAATAKRWNALMNDGTPVTPSALLGDINHSGKVDVTDVNIIINIMLGKAQASSYPGNADVNNSGKVDVSDVNKVINIMLGKEPGGTEPTPEPVEVTYDYTSAASLQALGFAASEIPAYLGGSLPIETKELDDQYANMVLSHISLYAFNSSTTGYALYLFSSSTSSQQGWENSCGQVVWTAKGSKKIKKVVVESYGSNVVENVQITSSDTGATTTVNEATTTCTFSSSGVNSFTITGSDSVIKKITVTYQ